jgi:aryl sulfotransferase
MLDYVHAGEIPEKNRQHEDAPMTETPTWPKKTRELQTRVFDSTIWNDFHYRNDDIVIATHPKAGTTWMQQIVAQLLFGGNPDLEVGAMSPWLDMRLPPKAEKLPLVEAQTHRRFIKTHLPLDALVFSPQARYIYVGRDGRDVLWSYHNHQVNLSQAFREQLNNLPGGVGPQLEPPPPDIREYWRRWLDQEDYPIPSFWDNVRSWWAFRDLPNVLLVHFANLKRDLPAETRLVAAFLGIPIDEGRWTAILEYCSFAWMKANAVQTATGPGAAFGGRPQVFFHRGVNGRWSDILTPADVSEYEARALRELGPECAKWVATGDVS